jgi:hypothetical protein
MTETIESSEVIEKLTKDAKTAAKTLTRNEARYLVDSYYQFQEQRKRAENQVRALETSGEPNAAISWLSDQSDLLESRVKTLLDNYSRANKLGIWARSQRGIGPVLASGLLAHIDIEKAPTCGHIWRYAGLDPTSKWSKGAKRPWNASLKTLCWKIGESFVKVCNHEESVYGKLYLVRKELETANNEAGKYSEQAKQKLIDFKIGKDTEAFKHYSAGHLPPAHIHERSKRYAVKIFLSHYHHVAYKLHHGTNPPKPFAIAILGHGHEIIPPNLELIES